VHFLLLIFIIKIKIHGENLKAFRHGSKLIYFDFYLYKNFNAIHKKNLNTKINIFK